MKKLCFVFLLLLVFSLCGCSEDNPYVQAWNDGLAKGESIAQDQLEEQERIEDSKGRYFEVVASDTKYRITYYRDIRTDVMYVTYVNSSAYGRGAAISVMFGTDGLPLTYEKWSQMEVSGDD